ncbi:MAG: hypothetical protein PWP57_652 [Candidatus Atribacteria bacterium]|nr:hypothetical protein [Candidatus Atribacteria bacterium]
MGCKRLFIFVEGEDDERFFEKIVEPELRKIYNSVGIIHYATLKKKKIENFLKSIKAMGAEYIFVTDIDESPCVTAKKQKLLSIFTNIDKERVIVVIKEIESWYLSGLDDTKSKRLGIHLNVINNTNNITKEQFNQLIPGKFDSRVDFMLEILKNFSIEIAKQKNKSFKYFIEKYNYEASKNDGNGG